MKLIAHRGNINSDCLNRENHPDYILEAIKKGYDAEVDVWYISNSFYLGHDKPFYEVEMGFLKNESIWCHAKNIEAFNCMLENPTIHCFWHQNDDFALTSKNYIWTFPGKQLTSNSICVLPERTDYLMPSALFLEKLKGCVGICSDFVERYKDIVG